MELTEEDGEDDLCEENDSEIQSENLAEISFNAILGKSKATTMKIQGKLNGKKVLILIDSGSTHNFIASSLVSELNIPSEQVPSFGVQIGNGEVVRCDKLCKQVLVRLPGLNTAQANRSKMFLIFQLNGKKYKLQGVPRTDPMEASLQSLLSPAELEEPAFPSLQNTLQEFDVVFSEPKELPPFRQHFHCIPLLPTAKHPNIRPYRYPHSQKLEIEKQIAELLEIGFIRPSTSPFASPVLLVKKERLFLENVR